jgi:hypothetical protein
MDSPEQRRAERYRQKAEELRAAAETMSHGRARESLVMLAHNYEVLAARTELISAKLAEISRSLSKAGLPRRRKGLLSRAELIDQYRRHAAEMRRIAETTGDVLTCRTVSELARDYEAIAAKLEAAEALEGQPGGQGGKEAAPKRRDGRTRAAKRVS